SWTYASVIQVEPPGLLPIFNTSFRYVWRQMSMAADKQDLFLALQNFLQFPIPAQIRLIPRFSLGIVGQKGRMAEDQPPVPGMFHLFQTSLKKVKLYSLQRRQSAVMSHGIHPYDCLRPHIY